MSSFMKRVRAVHKDQRGFTLIEVLVVMTILGILAAIVSISMLGVTSNARAKAKGEELSTVQAAFDAMLADQQVAGGDLAAYCDGTSATKAMTQFPGTASGGPADNQYPASIAQVPTFKPTVLATHYLRQRTTQYSYSCNATGDLKQSTEP